MYHDAVSNMVVSRTVELVTRYFPIFLLRESQIPYVEEKCQVVALWGRICQHALPSDTVAFKWWGCNNR